MNLHKQYFFNRVHGSWFQIDLFFTDPSPFSRCCLIPADDYHMPQQKRQATLVRQRWVPPTHHGDMAPRPYALGEASTIHFGGPYIIIFYPSNISYIYMHVWFGCQWCKQVYNYIYLYIYTGRRDYETTTTNKGITDIDSMYVYIYT